MGAGAQAWDQQGAFRVLRQDTCLLSSRWRCGLHIQTQWQSTATCQTTPQSLAAGMLSSRCDLQRLLQMHSAAGHH